MTERQNQLLGLLLALTAVGVLGVLIGVGASAFLQTSRVRTVGPIVTDRPVDSPVVAAVNRAAESTPATTTASDSSNARTAAAVTQARTDAKRADVDDHEVVGTHVRDEEHSDGQTREWPYGAQPSNGSEDTHK